MISGDAKWGAFRSAEVFCLPSHQENFGVVVAEALACGRPVLISDQVNIHTEISKANAGMVDRATKAGIATLLQRWAACSHQERQVMQTHARDAYVRFFQVTGAHHRLAQIAHTSHQHTTP
jgi:glycosyltransferase involved in cell wall biosynthesis